MSDSARAIAEAITELRKEQMKREAVSERVSLAFIIGAVVLLLSLMVVLGKGHSDNHRTQRTRIDACRTIEEPANRALCLTN